MLDTLISRLVHERRAPGCDACGNQRGDSSIRLCIAALKDHPQGKITNGYSVKTSIDVYEASL